MSKPKIAYLKNPETGVVFPSTPILEMNRKHFIPCDAKGIPNGSSLADVAKPVFKLLMNPLTIAFMPWSNELANVPGLIPCNTEVEGKRLLAMLTGTGGTPPGDDDDSGGGENLFHGIDLDADDAADRLRAYAMETYSVTLHHRSAVKTLLENIAELEAAKAAG